jgi:glycosyltransferase involved in cell wall biosynthesis
MLKIAIVTNTLAPHRVAVFSKIAQVHDIHIHVFAAIARGKIQLWDLPPLDFDHTILHENFINFREHNIHNNPDVLSELKRFAPDVIVTDGFNPTHLYAFFHALRMRLPHVLMTDATDISEQALGLIYCVLQRVVRRFIYAYSHAFVASSYGGLRLFRNNGLPAEQCFRSCGSVDNASFSGYPAAHEKRYDFIFCGRLEPLKNPMFALEVALQTAKKIRRRIEILFVGSGSQEAQVKLAAGLFPGLISAHFFGPARQHELLALYRSARLLLFPALLDPWNVVSNEACAAGLPVIISPYAGAADEVVRDGENGYVCDLDARLWASKAEYLLTRSRVYHRFSKRSHCLAGQYTFDAAAAGLIAACRLALGGGERKSDNKEKSKPRVLIVERQLLQYRVAFYNHLRTLLEADGIELQLLIGTGTPAEESKMDQVSLNWAVRIPTRYILGTSLCWQPFGAYAKDADLVVVMHENKIIYNLWLLSFGRPKRLAFWGHGRNMQSDRPDGIKERFKRWTVNKVDWWFAYTDTSAALVADTGFPSECTTIVENAIDTREMTAFCEQVNVEQCLRKRKELKLDGGPIALYLGSLYKEKRLDFLLETAHRIRAAIPEFQLLVVGAGPDQAQIETAAADHPWIHYLGPLQDRKKALVLVLADVILNPGLVGLGILDSFASGTPMFTTDCGLHSPEISYLVPGHNGVMTANDVGIYAEAVIDALRKPETIARLSQGARSSAPRYTIENMAERIRLGIHACLSSR